MFSLLVSSGMDVSPTATADSRKFSAIFNHRSNSLSLLSGYSAMVMGSKEPSLSEGLEETTHQLDFGRAV